jgi:hypothetical protein
MSQWLGVSFVLMGRWCSGRLLLVVVFRGEGDGVVGVIKIPFLICNYEFSYYLWNIQQSSPSMSVCPATLALSTCTK